MNLSYHDLIFLLIPAALAYVNNPAWSAKVKWTLALAVCILGAFIEVLATGQCNWNDFPATTGKVMVLVMGSYAGFWKAPFGKDGSLADKIENNHGTGN
jgi:hypothetical protein